MLILQASPHYAPDWHYGGPPRVLATYAKALRALGHDVEVLVPSATLRGSAPVEGEVGGIAVHFFNAHPNFLARWYWNFSPSELSTWLRRNLHRFDVVHLAQTRTLLNVLVRREAKLLGVPYVLSSFGSLPRRSGWMKAGYDLIFTRHLTADAALTLGQTKHELEEYLVYGGARDRTRLLPLAIDMDEIPFGPRTGRFRSSIGVEAGDRLVLFLGRLHETKGIDLLLGGFKVLADRDPRARLAIVGHDCGFASQLASKIDELGIATRVHVSGPIFGPERFEVYADADVYCITPRVFEETSLASLEALACGTPVVTNRRAEVPGLEDPEVGVTLDSDEPRCIGGVLSHVLGQGGRDGETRRRRVRAFAANTFSSQVVGARLEELLEEAVATGGERRGTRWNISPGA